jgi:hypothetical protein
MLHVRDALSCIGTNLVITVIIAAAFAAYIYYVLA